MPADPLPSDPGPPGGVDDEPGGWFGRRTRRVAIVVVLAVMAAMWIYIFLPSSRRPHPARLQDPSFAVAAEPVCAAALDALDELPPAQDTPVPEERAQVIDEADAILAPMVDDLRGLVPADSAEAPRIDEWLDDWETYLADRAEYADDLAAGDRDARFTEAPKKGSQLTDVMDTFAEVNEMPSCATPGDVA